MEDYLDSIGMIAEVVKVMNNIIMIYGGDFEMRGCISNLQDVMDRIATDLRS